MILFNSITNILVEILFCVFSLQVQLVFFVVTAYIYTISFFQAKNYKLEARNQEGINTYQWKDSVDSGRGHQGIPAGYHPDHRPIDSRVPQTAAS